MLKRFSGPELPEDEPTPPSPQPAGRLQPPPRKPPTAIGAATPRPSGSEPGLAASSLFMALEYQEWDAAATFIAAEELPRFRTRLLAVLLAWAARREDWEAEPPDLEQLARARTFNAAQLRTWGDQRVRLYRGRPTIARLAALAPEELLARSLEAAARFPRSFPLWGFRTESMPRRIVRVRVRDDQLAKVLYQNEKTPYVPSDSGETLMLRRYPEGWRALLNREVFSIHHLLTHLDRTRWILLV